MKISLSFSDNVFCSILMAEGISSKLIIVKPEAIGVTAIVTTVFFLSYEKCLICLEMMEGSTSSFINERMFFFRTSIIFGKISFWSISPILRI